MPVLDRLDRGEAPNFAQTVSVLKNSLYARFDPRSGTKHAVFGAF
jgi:hypothetical protein